MFSTGEKVRCVDAEMEGCGPALTEGRVYTVRVFTPASECAPHPAEWEKNGGRVELIELPGGRGAGFYGRRFELVLRDHFCSCGAALTKEEYAKHRTMGHDAGTLALS